MLENLQLRSLKLDSLRFSPPGLASNWHLSVEQKKKKTASPHNCKKNCMSSTLVNFPFPCDNFHLTGILSIE